ncbi:AMP-binding protein [Natrinema sp. 1APR25-10V2]|uniref:acyl-CoA synthetase n=1 Tax=Natrinema sp. 1APR25-10V2 TaxID=2951081 RepID=UPI0028755FBB|nr:AMP-binding protein [Natrinema sp. 1APR25-10V2]MDS0476961.1 AMP-binding protein [Natrinema sp. 1APR25-10V2]
MTGSDANGTERLDAYHFYEQEWDSYEALYEAFEWEVPEQFNIAAYVCDRWADDPERTAIYAEDEAGGTRKYSFHELHEEANQLANYLQSRGVQRGDRVGVNLPQKPETAVAHLACWKLGAISVPLSVKFGPNALGYRLDDAGAVACIIDRENVDSFREVRPGLSSLDTVLTVDADPTEGERDIANAVEGRSTAFETADTAAEDPAIIIYTSGTTGDPKGVLHAHRFFLGHLPLFVTDFCNMRLRDDVFWLPSEWSWIAAFDIVFPAWFYGKPVLAYESDGFDPATAFDLIDRYDVTVTFIPPTALRMMKDVDDVAKYDLSSLRTIAAGGEALDRDTFEWAFETFGNDIAVHEGYGQTEANMLIANCTALADYKVGKLGLPGPGHEIEILDSDTGEPTVPTGEVGEIAVKYEDDPVCFLEYWNKPEKTAETIQNGWLLTDDLGWVDEDGYYAFESRKDDVIISAGYRISPEEIEETLASHPAVAQVGVVGVPDDERGEVPKAFIEIASDYEETESLRTGLQEHVKSQLARYEYPREVVVKDELPKTTTGKVKRSSLVDSG